MSDRAMIPEDGMLVTWNGYSKGLRTWRYKTSVDKSTYVVGQSFDDGDIILVVCKIACSTSIFPHDLGRHIVYFLHPAHGLCHAYEDWGSGWWSFAFREVCIDDNK